LASITVQEGLDRLTKNQELKTILGYNWGCYGCEPKRASFIMQLLTTAVFLNGGYYPRGGPAEIPKKIVQNIRQHEGDVMVNARVKQILLEGSKAVGVEMQDGTVIRATEAVVSDVGFLHTTRDLLPPNTIRVNFCQNDRSQIPGQIHPGLTGFYLFVGLDKSPSDLNLPTSQHWLYPEFDTSACIDKIKGMPSLEAALDQLDKIDMTPIFVGNPGDKDSTWQQHHPNKTSLELLTLGPQWQWFEKYSGFDEANNTHGVDFETAKRRFADKMWARTVQVLNSFGAKLPLLLDDVAHFEIGSPLSFAHYYEASRGAFYGLDHDVNRFDPENFFLRLRPEVAEVPGLYLTGQDIVVDSLCGALLGGLLCAGKVLGAADPVALVKSLSVKTTRSKKRGLQIKPLPSFHVEDVYLSYPYDNM
jgi:all-trans-retinol 13,14-reductase